ncbi:hypothetical protein GIY62_20440 [Burkholderia plantarii]|uniref:DUF6402 family protein n=1 Tax=Burkholderia plantarii TaxID=41899 RepID=UPI00272C0FC7|nr:DUF6402 family protein [Burkholderia plantarii]WLE62762.1 hypothetical protein GIY62_20440 [Burkholderia plantarii]
MAGVPYYDINQIMWRWRRKEGALVVRGVELSMAKAPPPLVNESTAVRVPPPPKPKAQTGDGLLKMFEVHDRFQRWLNTPPLPKPPKPEKVPPTVPLFDIQEIPGAMRKEMMPVAAKLMERWFAGRLNYSKSEADQANEIDQNGNPYSDDMYEYKIVTTDWVLKFGRAREQFDHLINDRIYNPKALAVIQNIVNQHQRHHRMYFSAWDACDDDIRELHKYFQFQRVTVDSTFEQKAWTALAQATFRAPDDLTAALGSFEINAAIPDLEYDFQKKVAIVRRIVVYVKDSYSFQGAADSTSQYLGHWSKNGVIISTGTEAANLARFPWLDQPILTAPAQALYDAGKIYYPIRNRDFRQWQRMHGRGGDFIIYSNYKPLYLKKPIFVHFE